MTNLDKLKEWYRLTRRREFIETHDSDEAWNVIQQRIHRRRRVSMLKRWGSVAAVVLLVGGTGLWLADRHLAGMEQLQADGFKASAEVDSLVLRKMSSRQVATIQDEGNTHFIKVSAASDYSESLPDGTKIVMNAGARLKYGTSFSGDRRDVEFLGEAYFDVAHDERKPFFVSTPAGSIEVLGTHFNVVADDEQTTVTLKEGSVKLRFGDRHFLMKPGEQACMRKDGEFDVHHVNVDSYTSWSTGVYEFTDVPLTDIIRQLSLWYDVRIDIAESQLRELRYTGVIMRNESLENAIAMLTTVSAIRFDIKKNILTIHSAQ